MIFQDTFFCNLFCIAAQLVYSIVLVSGVHQSDSVLYFFPRNFSIIDYYKVLSIVPCAM